MFVKQFRTGGDRNFGYLVVDEQSGKAAVVDPSYSPATILRFADDNNYEIIYAFSTHGHGDHTDSEGVVEAHTGKKPLLYGDTEPQTGIKLQDGARLPLGSLQITIIHTPGHTDDSMCLLVEDAVFTGDTLFVGKVGGTNFGEGARAEYDSLHGKLMTLPDGTRVFPGHDVGVAPESTIGREKETNPFLIQPDFAAFLDLKMNWAQYKKEHGIA